MADHAEANRQHWKTWGVLTEEMDADDLFALLRGVVIAEGKLWGSASSVAAGIWLAQLLVERFPETWESVATWIKENGTHNSYLTSPDRPHSHLGEGAWNTYVRDETRRQFKHQTDQEAQQATAAERKRQRAREGQEREAAMRARQAEQTAHREESLARQESLSPVDRLRTILADDSVSMAWFPPEWGVVDADELAQLDTYEVERLLVLTRTRAARAWRGVRPALRADLARR